MASAGDNADVKRADTDADAKKRMRSIGFPEMDADGLPSSYSIKVTACLVKWVAKIAAFDKEMEKLDQCDKVSKLLDLMMPLCSFKFGCCMLILHFPRFSECYYIQGSRCMIS